MNLLEELKRRIDRIYAGLFKRCRKPQKIPIGCVEQEREPAKLGDTSRFVIYHNHRHMVQISSTLQSFGELDSNTSA